MLKLKGVFTGLFYSLREEVQFNKHLSGARYCAKKPRKVNQVSSLMGDGSEIQIA